MTRNIGLLIPLISAIGVAGCDSDAPATEADVPAAGDAGLVWAVNVGGPQYKGIDGTVYEAENSVTGGEVGRLEQVKGSQDPALYYEYREGDIRVTRALPDGLFDVTLHFAEPQQLERGERLFNVLINGETRLEDLDVKVSRDGQAISALTVTFPDIRVSDGKLEVRFEASAGQPLLSALVVRRKQPPSPDQWQMAWSDEFDGDGVDPAYWTIDEWPARKVNDEDQAYTARPENLRVEDGHLIIEAHKENLDDAEYTSGRIHSSGKGDVHYGRIEVRAKLPSGMGTWPAIWMLPSNPFTYATTCEPGEDWQGSTSCDAWPNSGEIDIMEHVGYEMNHVHGTVHNEAYYWAKWEQRKGRVITPPVDEAFHVYALEWTPEDIRIFFNDTLYFVYVNENNGWRTWPYDKPFHVILNVAVGGMWGRAGGGIDDSIFPQRMEVDYVRVYKPVSEG